nr:hypothetical protein MmNV_23 [Menippe mercenaria nudivirus]
MADDDIREGTLKCKELLKLSTTEDYSKKIVQQLYFTTIHLLVTAEVITNVLHKNNDNKSDKDGYNDVSYIHEESKTTRRNAHYKSTVLVVLYYLMFYSYYKKPPKNIGYEHIIHNPKAREFMKTTPNILRACYTEKKIERSETKLSQTKMSKKNKIKVKTGKCVEFKPIQHPSQFKQYTYGYRMSHLVDNVMKDLIEFAYNQYTKYCKIFIMINFAKKTKEKIHDDEERRNKRKPMHFEDQDEECMAMIDEQDKESSSENTRKRKHECDVESLSTFKHFKQSSVSDEASDSELIDSVAESVSDDFQWNREDLKVLQNEELRKNEECVNNYMKLSIEELNMKIKIPSVLMKFYQAFLLECDWEILFDYLQNVLTTGFCNATMMKLLTYLMCNITKVVCVSSQREGHNRNLDKLLKQGHLRAVVSQLHHWAYMHKFSIYNLPNQDIQSNITAYDLKYFKDYSRNTTSIYYHKTKNQVNLELKEREFDMAGIHIKYIEYNIDGCNKVIFDLLTVTLTANNTKIDLSEYSWKERLDRLKHILSTLCITENIAEVRPTSIREIQHDKLKPGNMYIYIRTSGLNGGTIFFTSNKKMRCTNTPKKRFRKLEMSDLLGTKLKPPDPSNHMNNSNQLDSALLNGVNNPNNINTPHAAVSELMARIGTIYSLLQENKNGLEKHLNAIKHQQHNVCSVQEYHKPESPIPSPKHTYNLDYLGTLMRPTPDSEYNESATNSLQYETFDEDDDF